MAFQIVEIATWDIKPRGTDLISNKDKVDIPGAALLGQDAQHRVGGGNTGHN
jgi:hypothetical protein